MAPTYIWCQHCHTGWVAPKDKQWYPKCWYCGRNWKKSKAAKQWEAWNAWNDQWSTAYPTKDDGYGQWCFPPPGLEKGAKNTARMTSAEYRDAVAQLWETADPMTQRLLRSAGIPPPMTEDAEVDPMTALSRVTSAYKQATAELRALVEKKGRLQTKADKAKSDFEKAVKDLAEVSQAIEKQTTNVAQAQEEVRRKVADQEQPRIQELSELLRTVGVELTESQQSTIRAKIATLESTEGKPPAPLNFDVWGGEKLPPVEMVYGPWLPPKNARLASRDSRSGQVTANKSPARSRSPKGKEDVEVK